MKSFGISYKKIEKQKAEERKAKEQKDKEQKDEEGNVEFELHVNLWDLGRKEKRKEEKPCIDFGLKIKQYHRVGKIEFYFPFVIKEKDIEDLYKKMKQPDVVSLIFNDDNFDLSVTKERYITYTREDGEKILLLQIGNNKNVEYRENENYTILTIDMESINKGIGNQHDKEKESAYIRFRIVSPEIENILWLKTKLDNWYLESAFSSKHIIDFKINEPRNIEEAYKTEARQKEFEYCRFKKVHFLLASPANGTADFFGQTDVSCRTLEESEWDTYLDQKYNTKDALAYHVKMEHKKEDPAFGCLVKTEVRKTKLGLILVYCGIVVILGSLGSLLWDSCDGKVKPIFWNYIYPWLQKAIDTFVENI